MPSIGAPFDWRLKARVVIPSLGAEERLEAVLEAMSRQTYPNELTSVVVVDDGSEPPLCPTVPHGLAVTVERPWSPNRGIAAAKAFGAALEGDVDVVVFIDSDMLAESQWLEAHMRWHHVRPAAVVVGFRRHVERLDMTPEEVRKADAVRSLFRGAPFFEPAWFEDGWKASEDGTIHADTIWRLMSGGNLSASIAVYQDAGGFDPKYWNAWGGEDNDLAHRLYTSGAVIVPDRAAMAWHLGHGTSHSELAEQRRERSRRRLALRVPTDLLPRPLSLLTEVPRVALQVQVKDHDGVETIQIVDQLLADFGNDIGLEIRVPEHHPDREFLELLTAPDPRTIIAVDDDESPTSWRYSIVRGWIHARNWSPGTIHRAAGSLGEGAYASLDLLSDGELVGQLSLSRVERLRSAELRAATAAAHRVSSVREWEL